MFAPTLNILSISPAGGANPSWAIAGESRWEAGGERHPGAQTELPTIKRMCGRETFGIISRLWGVQCVGICVYFDVRDIRFAVPGAPNVISGMGG